MVKELIENSLDSGATEISILVYFSSDNHSTIKVTDNGCGFLSETLPRACSLYYTSKSLSSTQTRGFRGGALAAACTLSSSVCIETCTNLEKFGSKCLYDSSCELTFREPISMAPGTTVTIFNLFHTLPVRKKYLLDNKKQCIRDLTKVVQHIAIFSYSGIRLTIDHNLVFRTAKLTKQLSPKIMASRTSEIFSPGLIKHAVPIKWKNSDSANDTHETNDTNETSDSDFPFLNGFIGLIHSPRYGFEDIYPPSPTSIPDLVVQSAFKTPIQYIWVNNSMYSSPDLWRHFNHTYAKYTRGWKCPLALISLSIPSRYIDKNVSSNSRILQLPKNCFTVVLRVLLYVFEKTVSSRSSTKSLRASLKLSIPQILANSRSSSSPHFLQSFTTPEPGSSTPEDVSSATNSTETGEFGDTNNDVTTPPKLKIQKFKKLKIKKLGPITTKKTKTNKKTTINHRPIPFDLDVLKMKRSVNILESGASFYPQTIDTTPIDQIDVIHPEFFNYYVIGQFNRAFIVCLYKGFPLEVVAEEEHSDSASLGPKPISPNDTFRRNDGVTPTKSEYIAPYSMMNGKLPDLYFFDQHACAEAFNFEQLVDQYLSSKQNSSKSSSRIQRHRNGMPQINHEKRMEIATKACHTSVVIGTPFSDKSQMAPIISNLAQLREPFHCPHGRPSFVKIGQ